MTFSLKTYKNPPEDSWKTLVKRPSVAIDQMRDLIVGIFDKVSEHGDSALRDYTHRFDKVQIHNLAVSQPEFEEAIRSTSEDLRKAIDVAYENIYTFHNSQKAGSKRVETTKGVSCWRESRPIESVGLYVPGGSAPLFSTLLMLAIPAKIAGCKTIQVCTPPGQDGKIHPGVLYAAHRCGIQTIFKIGGAQAIAAMALGTETIKRVDKLFGPGNQYVTAAKMHAFESGVAIDLPAGPSEVLVYTDEGGIPDFLAADLLSQAEHGPDSQAVLVTTAKSLIEKVEKTLQSQMAMLPRKEIAGQAMKHSFAVYFDSETEAFEFINAYAPEHLILASNKAESLVPYIFNAGSVFLGHYTPESAGDYASGTNHTLPTAGFARMYSGVSLDSFVKKITFQHIGREGLKNLGPHIMIMARAEMLEAHARAVEMRLKYEPR